MSGAAIVAALAVTATGCGSGLLGVGQSADAVATADGAVSSADGAVSSADGAIVLADGSVVMDVAESEGPYTDPAQLGDLIDVPGDPVGVWFWEVRQGSIDDGERTVPGPTDYLYLAVIQYATPEEAADAAGPVADNGAEEILADDWYPQDLLDVSQKGEWDRAWIDVTAHTPVPAWTDPVYVVDDAPNYIVVNYADPTN